MKPKRGVRKALGLLLAAVLMASTALPAFAATTRSLTGTFSINDPPSVDIVALTDTAMTPQSSYTITVDVSDGDTIDDIEQLVMKLWYDSDAGTPLESEFDAAAADAQDAVVVTWTKSGQSAVAPVLTPSGTTWALTGYTVPSSAGDFNGTTFQWSFTITVGKVATETTGTDKWQIGAKATDAASAADFNYDDTNASMNWYGEISGLTGVTVDWGTIAPGMDFGDAGAQQSVSATVTYVANGAYDEEVSSDATWSGTTYSATLDPTGATANADEFALKADDTANLSSAVLVDTSGVTIDASGTQTTESGDQVSTNTLWLRLSSSFNKDTYSGYIYFTIANGS